MIIYKSKYSSTEKSDDLGRWARYAVYKNVRIAYISRRNINNKITFIASLNFPTKQNDEPNEHLVCFNFIECKNFIYERWNWFLNSVLNDT